MKSREAIHNFNRKSNFNKINKLPKWTKYLHRFPTWLQDIQRNIRYKIADLSRVTTVSPPRTTFVESKHRRVELWKSTDRFHERNISTQKFQRPALVSEREGASTRIHDTSRWSKPIVVNSKLVQTTGRR